MTKKELIELVAKKTGNDTVSVNTTVSVFLQEIVDTLKFEDVVIQQFGTFRTAVAAERKIRNIQTGELMELPERIVVRFKASQKMLTWDQ